ncbi:unnamed protein product [Withania somnifera]
MESAAAADSTENAFLLLHRRRNSVVLPPKLSLSSSTTTTATASSSASLSLTTSSVNDDFELFSIKPVSYTSLRDLLPPSSVNSPGSEISIRNRLVKQAAWAYLQPMSTSPDSSGRSLFSRLFYQFPVNNPVAGVIEFVDRYIFAPLTRAVDWLLRAIRIWSFR